MASFPSYRQTWKERQPAFTQSRLNLDFSLLVALHTEFQECSSDIICPDLQAVGDLFDGIPQARRHPAKEYRPVVLPFLPTAIVRLLFCHAKLFSD